MTLDPDWSLRKRAYEVDVLAQAELARLQSLMEQQRHLLDRDLAALCLPPIRW